MTRIVSSLTAWGGARSLPKAFADAVAAAEDGVVQLAIGAKPVQDPYTVLSNSPVELIGHHAIPLGDYHMLRPEADPRVMIEALTALNITHYSAHPPTRKQATKAEMWSWALHWQKSLQRAGISFALETMYPTNDPKDPGCDAGWHLDAPDAVDEFLTNAQKVNWPAPLVVDGAHLHIGITAGVWNYREVEALAKRCREEKLCAEAHVSANDGIRDRHEAPGRWPLVDDFVWVLARSLSPLYIVDEGRRC